LATSPPPVADLYNPTAEPFTANRQPETSGARLTLDVSKHGLVLIWREVKAPIATS